jgi:hypothetical protein
MTSSHRSTRTRALAGCLALLASSLATGVRADEAVLPIGFQVGKLFVAPSLAAGMFVDSNPFFRSTGSTLPGEKVGDIYLRLNPAVVATLPFRNSWFRVAYDGVFRDYKDATTKSNNAQDVAAELSLLFSTYDRWSLRTDRSWGAADVIRFDGGEAVYDGTPYTFVTYETAIERNVAGKRGYAANIRYSDLAFDSTTYQFFDYDGFDGAFELREALNPTMWFIVGGAYRRYDHRLANDPTHAIYRQEVTDAILGGVQGISPHGQLWRVVLRYDRSRYPLGSTGSNYAGLGGEALVSFAPGPSSTVSLYATRRSWSSFYQDNNYYVANVLGCRAEKRWSALTSIGFDAYLSSMSYPEVDLDPVTNTWLARQDRLIWGELYANLAVGSIYAFRFTFVHQSRNSNAGGVDYRGDAFGVQFVLGVR